MILLIIAGIVSLISGVIFLSGEKNVHAVNAALSKLINTVVVDIDEFLLKARVGTGICLIMVGIVCLFIAYWIKVKLPVGGIRIF
jgi:uncharacterized membrane protein HdeD (DUF308 family)